MTPDELAELRINMPVRYGIDITSWVGLVPGAKHFYGVAWRHTQDQTEQIDIRHELSVTTARVYNREDGYPSAGFLWKPGMLSSRFSTREDVIAAGVKQLRETYQLTTEEIELGNHVVLENPIYEDAR